MNLKRNRVWVALMGVALLVSAGRAAEQEQKFMRFVEDNDGGGKLQTAIVTYKNADGVTLHLVGVVHIGEAKYYQDLAKTFEGYDALLYELIKPKDGAAPAAGARTNSMLSMFQRLLKDVLELDFQLDQIDYRAKNFVHADLDSETFAKMQEERGESLMLLMLRQMLNEMSKPQAGPDVSMTELLVALASPDRARHFKMILGRQFEDFESKVAGLEGEEGTVLLTERNKAAMKVVQQTIAAGKKNIGLFYGAAHMTDLEKRAMAVGFKPVKSEWRTAWDMTPKEGDVVFRVVKKRPETQPAK